MSTKSIEQKRKDKLKKGMPLGRIKKYPRLEAVGFYKRIIDLTREGGYLKTLGVSSYSKLSREEFEYAVTLLRRAVAWWEELGLFNFVILDTPIELSLRRFERVLENKKTT